MNLTHVLYLVGTPNNILLIVFPRQPVNMLTHIVLNSHLPDKPGLAGCPLQTRGFGTKFCGADALDDGSQQKYTLAGLHLFCKHYD